MRKMALAFALFLSAAAPVAAEDDPMELQRCIWRCLAGAKGPDDPKYHKCVEAKCDMEETQSLTDKMSLPAEG